VEAMEECPLFFPESLCWVLCFSLWRWSKDELGQRSNTHFSKLAHGGCVWECLARRNQRNMKPTLMKLLLGGMDG
jgi:hypothetical protein